MLGRRLLLGTLVVLTAACRSGAGSSDSTQPTAAPASSIKPAVGGKIDWKPCDSSRKDLMCARFDVPYDYDAPDKGTFSLSLVMRPASEPSKRIGSMLVNPGGPGFGGTSLPRYAGSYFSSDLTDVFDIVGWDPRGTGDSTPAVDCVSEYDPYMAVDPTPQNETQRQALIKASKDFADACAKKSGEILPYISTNATARDMDMIRAALGEDKITYFGFSYGSELGATWVTMFPSTVRAAVLDGAVDPESDYMQGGLDQAKGFNTEFEKYLKDCSADPGCAFHNNGDAEGAFDTLIAAVDAKPLFVSASRTKVNQAVAYTAVAQAMYSSSLWPDLSEALASAQKGSGEGLLKLYDDYYQRAFDGTYGNELEAFNAISCLDDPGPKTVKETDSFVPEFKKVAPLLWPVFTSGYGCVFWPTKPDPRIRITGAGAGPIVVVGTTGDAATPLAGTRNMAKALEDGRLIVVTDNRHTGYGSNNCVVSAVDEYLITTKVSFSEKAC